MAKGKKDARRARVLIVDDHPSVRDALTLYIGRESDMEICGEAADLPAALRLLAETDPDVVVVDLSLKKESGLDLIKQIKYAGHRARILVWSMHSESLYAERALRAGALGYVNKDQATEVIVGAIRRVLSGKVYLNELMSEAILQRSVGANNIPTSGSPIEVLADRELEVFMLIGRGLKTADIAKKLDLSKKTIDTYRDRIRHKLDLGDGTKLAQFAVQWVLVNG